MRNVMRLIGIIFVMLCTIPFKAANAESSAGVFVAIPGNREQQVWRFDTATTTGTKIGTYQLPDSVQSSAKPELKISPDGKWLASGWMNAEPPLRLELGRIGETLTSVTKSDDQLGYILDFGFSPDSRYFTYTLYSEMWTFGIIDLQSGKKAEFTGMAVFMPPDIDTAAPFGKMIPTVAGWSADVQTAYFETFLMLGCRGPHALYAAKVADLLSGRQGLPSTKLVSPKSANTFSYAFSPDRNYLAFAYDEDDCGTPTKLGVVTLQANQNKELIKASPDRAILVLGWSDNGNRIIFTSDPAEGGDSGPTFPLRMPRVLRISHSGGGPDKLPDLSNNSEEAIESIALNVDTLYYTVKTGEETRRKLYSYPASAKSPTMLAESTREIPLLLCDDTLYFTIFQSNKTSLYRVLPAQTTAQKLHEASQISFVGCMGK